MIGTGEEVYLQYDRAGIASVYCRRCDQSIGRIQTAPPADADEAETVKWSKKVEGEIKLIADEHRSLCPGERQRAESER